MTRRIEKETDRSFYYSLGDVVTTEHIHTYTDNKEEIFMTSDSDLEEDEHTLYLTYDSKQRVIEEKAIGVDTNLITIETVPLAVPTPKDHVLTRIK
jgi:hypothetical protein